MAARRHATYDMKRSGDKLLREKQVKPNKPREFQSMIIHEQEPLNEKMSYTGLLNQYQWKQLICINHKRKDGRLTL